MIRVPFIALLLLPALCVSTPASKAGPDGVDSAQVRRELQDILSRPEYDRAYKASASDKFKEKVGKWIQDALIWLRKHLTFRMDQDKAGLAATVFAWLVAAAFLFLLAVIVHRLILHRGHRIRLDEDDLDLSDYNLPSSKPLISEAVKLAKAGDYKGAFRCAYLASISHLDEVNALRFERSRTNWEYMRELQHGGHDNAYDLLHPLTLDFDRVFYGRESCGSEEYERAIAAYKHVTSEAA